MITKAIHKFHFLHFYQITFLFFHFKKKKNLNNNQNEIFINQNNLSL